MANPVKEVNQPTERARLRRFGSRRSIAISFEKESLTINL
jgi:hypothetical protein